MKKIFKISLKIKNCSQVFIPGEPEGVIAVREAEFDLAAKKYEHPQFILSIINQEESLIKETIETKIEEVIDP